MRRESGQIVVLFAAFLMVLLILAGSAYDYASIVVDDARLQNAVDAASLAAASALAANAALPALTAEAVAQSTAVQYLSQNTVAATTPGTNVVMAFPTSTPVGTNPPSSVIENLTLSVTRNHPTAFWPLVGISSVNLQAAGSAGAARNMLDIMLTLDTTGSLVLSNNLHDYTSGQGGTTVVDGVTNFITHVVSPSSDPRGPKVGIARYAGIKCQWHDSTTSGTLGIMDVYSGASPPSEYVGPCTDDDTVLTPLINDQATLLTIARGGPGCPATAVGYGCPIQHVPYIIPGIGALFFNNSLVVPLAPYFTGTKEPNAICVVNPTDALCAENPPSVNAAGWAWSTANGARNCTSWPCPVGTGSAQARRVELIMTDGQNEAWPTSYVSPGTPDPGFPEVVCCGASSYDGKFQTLAARLKATPGPDGGPAVEIFIIGYFCTSGSYSPGTFPPNNFCQSKLAYTSAPRACPGPTYAPGGIGSPVDDLLVGVSSSSPGSCDHYFPMSKNEDLSKLFAEMAGTISRGQLTQ